MYQPAAGPKANWAWGARPVGRSAHAGSAQRPMWKPISSRNPGDEGADGVGPAALELSVLLAGERAADRLAAEPVEGLRGDPLRGGVDEGEAGVVVAAVEGEGGEGAGDHVGGADAVAGVAGGGEAAAARQRDDERDVGRRDVDRAAPGMGDASGTTLPRRTGARVGQSGEVGAEALGGGRDHVGVELRAAAQAGAHRDPAASPAEGDAAIGGGAEVVDQGAAVGDALASRPADPLEQLRHRLGEDDVRRGDGEGVAQRPMRRLGGPADRDDRRPGADGAAVGLGEDAGPARRFRLLPPSSVEKVDYAAQPSYRRALVDLDAGGEQALAQAERQARRLHRGGVLIEGSAAEGRRGAAAGDLVGAQHPHGTGVGSLRPRAIGRTPSTRRPPFEVATGGNGLVPDAVVRGRGRDLQVAAAAEPGIDPLVAAERLHPVDRLARGARHRQAGPIPPALPHTRQREPHRVAKPPIPPTRPMPADIGLQDHNPTLRLQLLQMPSRPKPGIPAPENHDISTQLPLQRRKRLNLSKLLKPVAMSRVLHRR